MAQLMLKIPNAFELISQKKRVNQREDDPIKVAIGKTKEAISPYLQNLLLNDKLLDGVFSPISSYLTKIKTDPERAWFVNLACDLVASEKKDSLHAMAAVELRYLATMILDDMGICC